MNLFTYDHIILLTLPISSSLILRMTTLSEAYGNNPLDLHHIIPLDFDSVDSVPESHQWPSQSNETLDNIIHIDDIKQQNLTIPVIDLTTPKVVELVGSACQTWGMFQITNHGIPVSLVEKVESEARRFFSLPTREKRKVLRSPGGGTGYGAARIAPFFSKFMWHEGFTIMGSSIDHAKQLWPDDYLRFCDAMNEYQEKMKALAYQLLLIILKSLNITEEDMNWTCSTYDSQGALQLNSYPCCPNPNRAIGLPPHTDTLLLTILHQSDVAGLQIFRDGLGWISVSPVSGALVVNVGDLLHIYSNAKFPTAFHRAVVNEARHRISVAYFYGPPVDSIVAPLPFSKLEDQVYRCLYVKEYISLKAKHLSKALSLIRI